MAERERVLRLAAEQQLSLITNVQPKDLEMLTALEEKDRRIEQLSLSLKSKDALVQRLEEAKSQQRSLEESWSAEKNQDGGVALVHEKEQELEALQTEFGNEKKDLEKRIQSLQEELRERETELSVEKRNALKRDKTIQGLTLALKTKENENEELNSEIEGLNASLAKSREAIHKAQMQKFRGAEDSQTLLMEKENTLADLHSENLSKDTENRKLQRKIKRTEQELNELYLEREKLVKDLEEAHLQNSRGDKTINDLRNQLEKTLNEMDEKEKATERHYGVLLSESNQKLQNQELAITRLMDSIAQKDELLQNLDGVVKGKDAELQEWFSKFQSLLKDRESLQRQNEDLVKERFAARSQPSVSKLIQELEKTRESECTDMIQALQKQHGIFTSLIKSLKDADGMQNLQEELSHIFLLRKQLEDDILANWNLRKVLEDQIMANRKEEETVSFCSNQTSYMSICLREPDGLDLQIDHLTLEELKKKIVELLSVVKELHAVNQDLKRKQLEFSALDPLAKERWKVLENSEFLERTEESRTLIEGFDEEASGPSCRSPETASEQVILSDYSDRQCRNLNKSVFEHEMAVGEGFVGSEVDPNCEARERSSLVSLLNENGATVLGSRQEQMKIANKLLDHPDTTERDSSSDDLENKDEKDLKRLIIQLRAQLKELTPVNKSLKQPVESKPTPAEKEGLDPEPVLQINAEIELSKGEAKDAAAQTTVAEGNARRRKHEGKTAASEGEVKSSRLSDEHQRRRASAKSKQQETFLCGSKTYKSDPCYQFKKSRLPVLRKLSRSLESISLSASPQKADMHLQHRIFTLDEDLKGRRTPPESLSEGLPPSEAETEAAGRETLLLGAASFIKLDDSEVDVSLASVESKGELSEDPSASQAESLIKLDDSEVEISLASVESKDEMMREDQSTSQETEAHTLETDLLPLKGPNQESDFPEKQDVDTATLSSVSKSLLSLKPSVTSDKAFDCEAVDDVEELRRRIEELKSEVAKYQMLMTHFGPAKEAPPGDIFSVGPNKDDPPVAIHCPPLADGSRHDSQIFSGVHQQAESQVHVADLVSNASDPQNEEMVKKLRELLSENETELEKEQIANMHLLDKVCRLQSKLKAAWPMGPSSPIDALSPEDSCQRQHFQESHSICATYRQHLTNLIRTFEELLQASEVDYYVAESFRKQLNQSAQLFERLELQCLYGDSVDDEMSKLCGLARSLSNFEMSERSFSLESPEHKKAAAEGEREKPAAKFPPELLMEHLQEIRMLRYQLEESIRTNERLRKQLVQQGSEVTRDQGSASVCIHGSEQHNSLTSEIHFLRKQNQALNVMLAKGSRDKQKENEKLRESLSQKELAVQHLQKDCERLGKENEKLQKQVGKQEDENGRLTHEVYNVRNELNRLQAELNAKQHQLSENDRLLHSLRLELKVYEKLDETIRSQKDHSCDRSDECWKDQNQPLDLHELLTEIQNLRTQLERSIQANKILHESLEEHLSRGKRETGNSRSSVNISSLFKTEWHHFTGINEFKFPSADSNILELQQKYGCYLGPLKADAELALDNADSSSQGSSSATKILDPCPVPGHCVWADKNGRHVLGLIEDYNSLRKQISEGQKLLSELQLPGKDAGHREFGVTVPLHASQSRLSAALCAIQRDLDEAARLLKCLWRVSLPMKVVHSAAYSFQDEGLKAELHKLRRKLAEQEKKLHSTVKRLHSTHQLKENMEKVILDQLTLTHDVLKKARGNLEVQPPENKTSASSLSRKRVL
ncbi:CDK5 regulatory subunit-associated protein 2 isoform X1 [Elgaria multicarinata webbii]|uniref:CDK5 regulatory subunit-associated protein 2 isoform X1 n=1 Tax=Elgaria multicarinata webbii TaxID=159646 RepID=UPI002FCD3B19